MTKLLTYIFIFLFTFTSLVKAQVSSQIQRQQQQLIDAGFQRQELERALRKTPTPTSSYMQSLPEKSTSTRCVDIREIDVDSNTKISTTRIKKIAQPYLNKCLTVDDINKILNTVTNAYIDAGYITSGAYLINPQTKLKDGILQVKIYVATMQKRKKLPS